MQITSPSLYEDIQSDTKWTAICSICLHWSSGNNREQVREQLQHHIRCKYINVYEDRINWIKPKKYPMI